MNTNTIYRDSTIFDFTVNSQNFVRFKYDIKMYKCSAYANLPIDINQFYYIKNDINYVSFDNYNNSFKIEPTLTLDCLLICTIYNKIYVYNCYHKSFYIIQINEIATYNLIDNYDIIPIYNQYELNSCTAFAISYIFSYYVLIEKPFNDIIKIFNGSELSLYYHERLIMERRYKVEYTDFNYGVYIDCAINAIELYGMCFEKINEYDNNVMNFDEEPDNSLKYYKVNREYTKKLIVSIDNFKKAINNNLPIIFGMQWYDTFNNGTITLPIMGNIQGGHAVVCVGYDDNKQVFIIRNSWGMSWGSNGHFLLPYDYFNTQNIEQPWCITSNNLSILDILEDTTSEIDTILLGNRIFVTISTNINNIVHYLKRNIDNTVLFVKTIPIDESYVWQIEDQCELRRIIKLPINDSFIKIINNVACISSGLCQQRLAKAGYSNTDIYGNLIDNYLSIVDINPDTNEKIPNVFYFSGPSNYMNYDFINIEKTGNDYKIIKSSIRNIVKITISLIDNY